MHVLCLAPLDVTTMRAQNAARKKRRYDFLVVLAVAAASSTSHYAIIKDYKETAFATIYTLLLSQSWRCFLCQEFTASRTQFNYMMYNVSEE